MTDRNHWKAQETLAQRIVRVGYTITATGCWEWNGYNEPRGYAKVMHGGKSHRVHRVMLEAKAPNPEAKTLACHTCDNRSCINPEHLYWGDHADNSRDIHNRGRFPAPKRRKIPREADQVILDRRRGGESFASIGKDYGVSAAAIRRVVLVHEPC